MVEEKTHVVSTICPKENYLNSHLCLICQMSNSLTMAVQTETENANISSSFISSDIKKITSRFFARSHRKENTF